MLHIIHTNMLEMHKDKTKNRSNAKASAHTYTEVICTEYITQKLKTSKVHQLQFSSDILS